MSSICHTGAKGITRWSNEVSYPTADRSDLVITIATAAQDLLERKSAIYSDRPRMIVVNEYISNNRRMVLQPYNDTWRALRKFLHSQLVSEQALPPFPSTIV